ncbi:Vps36-domain-containing protein [Sodiomyces alkalinus F11]|uniref:Vacuolar protein-sorting-associated protein 36 n=1 Tax=Sodiomyces alkalinus (strain CBS 110278 / VKM F-3762 / F11) TaxID=1314773 RepID=A0A3N2Q816_SODAK|nr:Vps36-domain-containing protein [Sodiomyces alkalinus F11]ROT42892.1 Vps36-domain-containing protein [Sodiomyces alkalinus F11]
MFLKHLDLTTALRPAYLPDEALLFVQDNVGLYEGKYKLPNQQNGQVYLTSHRICYVDKEEPRKHSVALDLRDVDRYEFYAGFLKSSPKVTLVPKPLKKSSLYTRASAISSPNSARGHASSPGYADGPYRSSPEPALVANATWVCTICSFSNAVPSNFDPTTANLHTPLPPCLACGIKPTLAHVLKAAISNATSRPPAPASPVPSTNSIRSSFPTEGSHAPTPPLISSGTASIPDPSSDSTSRFQCPRCTFLNHPSLLSCEICGASLLSQNSAQLRGQGGSIRTESPGPVRNQSRGLDTAESIKVSFRGGGEKIFYERLKGSMIQRKWLLQGAPPVPKSARTIDENGAVVRSPLGEGTGRKKGVGIAGLEQRGLDIRKNNEVMIGSAFEDLDALMASAKEIVALAERFARQGNGGSGAAASEANTVLAESASQLGLVTTKDIVGGSSSERLYLSELARNLAEFLTDDARGVLRKAGGVINFVDLWAMFNRARGGVELVSPNDFEKAARMWEPLKLPVRLRTFKSGVMVVQSSDRTDETTIKSIRSWLADLREFPPDKEVPWNWHRFGRGVTARDAAERFGWSIGVAEEELEMAEERGILCREEGIEGLKFWENFLDPGAATRKPRRKVLAEPERILKALEETGFL